MQLSEEKIHINSINFTITTKDDEESLDIDEPKKKKRELGFFKVFKKENRNILLLLFAVLFWFMGFAAIEAFFTLLGTDYFGLDVDIVSSLGLAYPISMIIASLPTGLIGKKFGRKKTLYLCLGFLLVSLTIIASVIIPLKSVIGIGIMMGIVGFFWMGVIVNTFPILWRMCPENEVATYTGIYYTFNQSAAILGPIIIGGFFDIAEVRLADATNVYWILFPFVIFCVLVALIFFIFVKGGEAKQEDESNKYY
jgi:MFS family permease